MMEKIDKRGPNFVVVGFPKAGTTWLFDQLSLLPDFNMPVQKEIHYFDRSQKIKSSNFLNNEKVFDRLVSRKLFKRNIKSISHVLFKLLKLDIRNAKFLLKWYFSNFTNKWYLSLFNRNKGFTGDVTPTYCMLDRQSVQNMKACLSDDVKIIFVLRNPIDRAWSHFRMSLRKNKLKGLNHNLEILKYLNSEGQVERSNYLEAINLYKEIFGQHNLLISYYDVLKNDQHHFLFEIVNFIGGNPNNIKTYCNSNSVVHKSVEMEIPSEIKEHLIKKNHKKIEDLSNELGGYCSIWLKSLKIDD